MKVKLARPTSKPSDNYTPLSYSELRLIEELLESHNEAEATGPTGLRARIRQQLERSEAIYHSVTQMDEPTFRDTFFARYNCLLCFKEVNIADARIHIARKHFTEIDIGTPQTVTGRRGRPGRWFVPRQLSIGLWRTSNMVSNWEIDGDQEFYDNILLDMGQLPYLHDGYEWHTANGHRINYLTGDNVWQVDGEECYDQIRLEAEVPA